MATVLRVVDLGARSLWLDEAASSMLARSDWHTFWSALLQRQANMAFYYLLLREWIRIPFSFAATDAGLRLLSVILGVAAVLLAYKIMLATSGARAAWIASFLLAINAFHIQYSQEARGYALVVFLTLASCWLFLSLLRQPKASAGLQAGYILVSVLMIYAHLFGMWIVLAQLAAVLVMRSRTRTVVCMDAAIILVFALPLVVSLALVSDRSQLSWMNPSSAPSFYAVLVEFSGGGLLLIVFAALLLFSLRGYWRMPQAQRPSPAVVYAFLWMWLLLPIVIVGIVSLYRPALQARYLIVSLPAFLLLAADGLARIRSKVISIVTVVAITGFSTVGLNSYYRARVDVNHSDNWRDATAYCLSHARPGDAVLFTYSAEEIPFRVYQGRLVGMEVGLTLLPQRTELELLNAAGTWTTAAEAADAASRYRRVWVVTALQPSGASLQAHAALRKVAREESRRDFGFVRVQEFVGAGL